MVNRAEALLPMYALPEMAAVNEGFWAALRKDVKLPDLPERLSPAPAGLPASIAAETVFSQMCGYPLKRLYANQFIILGTPLYDLPGCGTRSDGMPMHCSLVVVAREAGYGKPGDLRGARFAVNGFDSNSGMNLPRRLFADIAGGAPFFSAVTVTGSHVASMAAVAAGAADAAAIDCVTFGFCALYRPEAVAGLRILARTPASPAIPFITSSATPPATVARLMQALAGPALAAALSGLRVIRVTPPRPEAYEMVLTLEGEAAALGYPVLA
jgi:ABC-type phosphate/phosphonate transport system substrate-binding protein